jgi:hypothetical protein
MLDTYINQLQSTIQWAQFQDDIDTLCLARDRMDQLLDFSHSLPVVEQQRLQQRLDEVLPMEWPLWMEACRYQDGQSASALTLH